jgi:hypothetical protein
LARPIQSQFVLTTLLAILAACGGSGASRSKDASTPPGTIGDKPDGSWFIADANQHGNAQEPRLVRLAYGRLVQVFGMDAFGARVPMATDFLVDPGLVGDGQTYQFETNPITAQENLIILRNVNDPQGRTQFFQALISAEQNLVPIHEANLTGAGIYSMLPRNATLMIQFDDLVDPATLDPTTVRGVTGTPPASPFEARVFADSWHGDLAEHDGAPGEEFYSTRILFDPTVTEIESFSIDPPLPLNGVGLPPSSTTNLASFALRIPTKVSVAHGQIQVLRNPSGHAQSIKNNGPVDLGSPTLDVVRAARSGGATLVTGDPFNGFLPDDDPPQVVGGLVVFIEDPPQVLGDPREFLLPKVRFGSSACAQTPIPGDILTQTGIFAEVLTSPAPVEEGLITNLRVRLLLYPTYWDSPGGGGPGQWANTGAGPSLFLSAFDSVTDAEQVECFVRVFPDPAGYPQDPSAGIQTSTTFSLRFSEPMDPLSLTAFDSLTLTRVLPPGPEDPPLGTDQFVVGSLSQSLNLLEFFFNSDLPLAHEAGEQEPYWFTLATQPFEPTDLAGNGVLEPPPPARFTIDANASPEHNGGRVIRFRSVDEEPPLGSPEEGPIPEWNGQHQFDLMRQLIQPRPVVHWLGLADRSNPVPALMTKFGPGVQTPLSSLGSRMHTVWRYVDFGMSLTDFSQHNIDLEGMYWSPANGQVLGDQYTEFQITLAHSAWAPDEYVDPASNLPKWGQSGLHFVFKKNVADPENDPAFVIHEKFRGYQLNPGDLFVAQSGTKLVPWPVNRGVSPEDWRTYTWRNTDLRVRAGEGSGGVPPWVEYLATGSPKPSNQYYGAKFVRTIGLPLLMDFSCYPDEGAVGQNPFDISLASNTAPTPYFRAFSTGGINKNGKPKRVDPDLETKANGGFNPGSTPPGDKTPERDNSYYVGAADFVVRVSRTHSIWFAAGDPLTGAPFPSPAYRDPLFEPPAQDQPPGTAVKLAYRGMTSFDPPDDACDGSPNYEALEDARAFDSYGDHYDDKCPAPGTQPNHGPFLENKGITFLAGNDEWRDEIDLIDGAPYYQVRITFESDIFSGLVPTLSALAINWTD